MVLARLRIFYREPEALFWVYFFPILMAVGLAVAFWNRPPNPPVVDVIAPSSFELSGPLLDALNAGGIQAQLVEESDARQRYLTGKSALYLRVQRDDWTFGYDPTRTESISARYHVEAVCVGGNLRTRSTPWSNWRPNPAIGISTSSFPV
jgi:hypothetical protein